MEELLPVAIECGLSEKDFLDMTLREVRMYIDGFWKRIKKEWERSEYQSWLTAYYVTYSIGTNFSKKIKFPNNPLNQEQSIMDVSSMDEDEIAKAHEDFLEKLDFMAKSAFKKCD